MGHAALPHTCLYCPASPGEATVFSIPHSQPPPCERPPFDLLLMWCWCLSFHGVSRQVASNQCSRGTCLVGGVGGRGLSGGRSRSDPLGDDDAWQIVPPQDTGIGTMEESIAASVNYVANLQAAEGGTAGERAARFVQVSPQEWYLNTIREWVQRHSRIPM